VKDSTIPSFSVSNEGNITITIPQTQALLQDQGYTYNQAGLTYNQTGIQYGGVYNTNQDFLPILSVAKLEQPSLQILSELMTLSAPRTQAQLENQGYTYNQSGLTYNQIGVMYGGVYNTNQDVLPMELSFTDIYSIQVTPGGGNIPLGPGFFLFIPQ
jgi:hypothetical protein